MLHRLQVLAIIGAAVLLAGCSSQDFGGASGFSKDLLAVTSAQGTEDEAAAQRSQQLAAALVTWQQQHAGQDEDYPIGAEDVVEISVFALEQPAQPSLLSRRVNGDGMVNLPFVGDVHVAGLTTRQIIKAVTEVYDGTYLRNPQVDVSVTEYRSAPVVVTGAVRQPGIYYLRRKSSTVLEMLSMANGLAPEAGNELVIVRGEPPGGTTSNAPAAPADSADALPPPTDVPATNTTDELSDAAATPITASDAVSNPVALAPSIPAAQPAEQPRKRFGWFRRASGDATVADTQRPTRKSRRQRQDAEAAATNAASSAAAPAADVPASTPISAEPAEILDTELSGQLVSVDLRSLLDSGDIRRNASVRGGDVITVPPKRKEFVFVLGYVQRPGAIEVRDDAPMQAMHAVAMAGGLSGSARAQNSTLITEADGVRRTVTVDLTSMKRGESPPAYLRPGDILIVGSSSLAKLAEFIKLSAGASYSPPGL